MTILETKSFQIAANTSGDEHASRVAILMPGRLDTKDYANFVSHVDFLASRGFYAIAIDVPGTWDSPGDIANYSTSLYIQVINELVDYFENRPTLLLGHSRGGATAMLASANPAVNALVLVNAAYGNPSTPDPKKFENNALPESRDLPPGDVRTKEQKHFNLPIAYFEDGAKHNPVDALNKFEGPKLLIHAKRDEFTGLEEVRNIFDELKEPKMFLEIDCVHDYRLYPEAIKKVNEAMSQFVQKYLSQTV